MPTIVVAINHDCKQKRPRLGFAGCDGGNGPADCFKDTSPDADLTSNDGPACRGPCSPRSGAGVSSPGRREPESSPAG